MIRIIVLNALLYFSLFTSVSSNNLALPCAGCHGPKGNSPGQTIPSINNLEKNYFIKAFKAYKNGTRENYVMRIISNGYSDEEIEMLANYYVKKN